MIAGNHAFIRGAEPDDAPFLHRFYQARRPRAALLDQHREPLLPTAAELEELLARKDGLQGSFYTIEDLTGVVRGFCSLRGANQEAGFADLVFLLDDDAAFGSPLAAEALAFILARGYGRMGLRKILGHCLEGEESLRDALTAHGFESDGVQRQVLFTAGRWYDMETLTRFARPGEGVQAPRRPE